MSEQALYCLPQIKTFSHRDLKGYNGEVYIYNNLVKYKVKFKSNPLSTIEEWKRHQGKGCDFVIDSYNIELESKNIDGKVFRSWILRDWIPRFSYNNETRIVAIPSTTKLSDNCLNLLFTYDINILYWDSIKYLFPNRRLTKLCNLDKDINRDSVLDNNLGNSQDNGQDCSFYNGQGNNQGMVLGLSQGFNQGVSQGFSHDVQDEEEVTLGGLDASDWNNTKQSKLDDFIDMDRPSNYSEWREFTCEDCTKYLKCSLLKECKSIEYRLHYLISQYQNNKFVQIDLDGKLKSEPIDKEKLKHEYRQLHRRMLEVEDKIYSCLKRRRYLYKLGYHTFRRSNYGRD
ncbi:hypothetical protein [Saccharolobus sp.]|uniref:hypothetical protein n=1 Tax=Saccharolobus sp. TaxID=2100761 RepID=UPI0031815A3A